MNVYFTADLHLSHANIIKYAHRPFWKEGDFLGEGDIAERPWASDEIKQGRVAWMNSRLIANINKRVKPGDVLYHVGDFCFRTGLKPHEWEKQINCKVIHIMGNHDGNNGLNEKIHTAIMDLSNKQVLVQHRPPTMEQEIPEWCDFVVCGHVHDNWAHRFINGIPIINVGVDVWNYEPVSLTSLLKACSKLL